MAALIARDALDAKLRECLDLDHGDETKNFAARYFLKKVWTRYTESGVISRESEDRALEKFLSVCKRMKNFSFPIGEMESKFLKQYQFRCFRLFDSIDLDELSLPSLHELGGVGPGASVGAFGTDFLRKLYYGPVSATSVDVLHSYLRGSRSNPLDFRAAKRCLDVFGWNRELCSHTSFVLKNEDEARTIATEPSVNMFYQLALGKVINKALGHFYHFSVRNTPRVNRLRSYWSSMTGSHATIDLSSASDSVSLQLLELSVRGFLKEQILLFRCEYTRLPDGRILRLPMVSTMGNGWTFSLMTAMLYCMLHAVCDLHGKPGDIESCSVFGDDIVVPLYLAEHVYYYLGCLGFIVNREKSFSEGPFRESCGHDFYRGRFVRPVFVKRLDTLGSLFVAFNRIAEWGSFHSIDMFSVLSLLRKSIMARYDGADTSAPIVPVHSDYASGFKVPSLCAQHLLKGGIWRYKRLEAVPLTYDVNEVPVRVRTISPLVNPDGVIVSQIGGYLRNGKISERSESKVHWRLARRITPNWDTRDDAPCPFWDSVAERRWKATVGSYFIE